MAPLAQQTYILEKPNPYASWIGRRDPISAKRLIDDIVPRHRNADECLIAIPAQSHLVDPPIKRDVSLTPLLTGSRAKALNSLLEFLIPVLRDDPVIVSAIEVIGYVDNEEFSEEILVTLCTSEPGTSAMQFWNRIGAAIDEWLPTNPNKLRSAIRDSIVVNVRWRTDSDNI